MEKLQTYLYREIPITRAMGIRVGRYDDSGLILTAPLSANINDKTTAFAGSLATLLTLSGWALTHLVVQALGRQGDVVISDGRIRYLMPVHQDLEAVCAMPTEPVLREFKTKLLTSGTARWELHSDIRVNDRPAVTFSATYIARVLPG